MTDEKIFQRTICPAYQWSAEAIVKAFLGFLNCLSAHQKTWYFLTASVPISSKRRRNQAAATDSGTEDCVYREASDKFDPPSQTMGEIKRRISEWSRGASLRRILEKAKAWLRNLNERFKCNIFLTDRFSGSFPKSIVCWFHKEIHFIVRKKYV